MNAVTGIVENAKKNLHIIIYSPFPSYSGGRENWLFNLLPYISKDFNRVFIYALKSGQDAFYDLSSLDNVILKKVTTLYRLGYVYMALNRLLLQTLFLLDITVVFRLGVKRALLKEIKPGDVIMAMNSITECLPALDVKSNGVMARLVSSVRGRVPEELGVRIPWLRKWFNTLERDCLSRCDAVLANGYDTQAYLRDIGIDSTVVPNGVDIRNFQSPSTDDPDLEMLCRLKENGKRIVLTVATLRKIKGTDDLLEAGQILINRGVRDFLIVFVGKGMQNEYKRKARELGIQDYVLFVGEKKNIPGFLSIADLVVCAFGGGGMSMSVLEAMAAGKPIIAWDTPMYVQLFEHRSDGYLVKNLDITALAEGIKTLLEDEKLSKKLAKRAQEKASQYDWPIVAEKLLDQLASHPQEVVRLN